MPDSDGNFLGISCYFKRIFHKNILLLKMKLSIEAAAESDV
jgi:hypothetical protein